MEQCFSLKTRTTNKQNPNTDQPVQFSNSLNIYMKNVLLSGKKLGKQKVK